MKRSTNLKYINKTFDQWMSQFTDYSKIYYPQIYNDFNESNPGNLFFEISAYVGDVLSFYLDRLYRENLFLQAQERKNVVNIAQSYGYKPKLSTPSIVDIDVFQLAPASGSGTNITYDQRYCTLINQNTLIRTNVNDTVFIIQDSIDFSINTVTSPVSASIYRIDATSGLPEYYLLKKTVRATSADIRTVVATVGAPIKYWKYQLADTNVIGILDVTDSDGLVWTEVEYLAQNTVFDKVVNDQYSDQTLSAYSTTVPYLLRLKQVPRRFITRVNNNDLLELRFGAGVSSLDSDVIIPSPENVGLQSLDGLSKFDISYDPSNFLYNRTYGDVPSNTNLTIRYLVGGGVQANVPANTINEIVQIDINRSRLPQTNIALNTQIINSIAFNNPEAAQGGSGVESTEEIRQRAIGSLMTQNRAVSREDYIVRAHSMDPKFGLIAKAYVVQDDAQNLATLKSRTFNPLTLNLYCLGKDVNGNVTPLNQAVKQNLKLYLNEYRMLTDNINVKDAHIINIRVLFDIITKPEFNDNDVLLQSINVLKTLFHVDNWQINQPIIIGDIYSALKEIDGVQHISSIKIENVYNNIGSVINQNGQSVYVTGTYSNAIYDIPNATRRGIIYPSMDPSIFEVKYPDRDIIGRASTY